MDWSVFGVAIRANNNVDGCHTRLNHHGQRDDFPMYILIDLLWKEAKIVKLQAQLVLEEKLTRNQQA